MVSIGYDTKDSSPCLTCFFIQICNLLTPAEKRFSLSEVVITV